MDRIERAEYINNLEMENERAKLNAQLEAAEKASEQQRINFITTFIVERAKLDMMALFGIIKLDR